ncbi:MAG: vWA domain-containing protein, partial [Nitriliruptorales bacterium]
MSDLLARLHSFAEGLRRAGVPVAVSQTIDATSTLRHLDLLDRTHLREGLAAVLVKSHAQRRAFDELFDVYFPPRRGLVDPTITTADLGDPDASDEYLERLIEEVMSGDDESLRRLAREAVDRFGRAEGRDGGASWFQYRVWRAIDLPGLLERMLRGRAGGEAEPSPLERRLWRDEFEARLRTFREEVDAEIRRRWAE